MANVLQLIVNELKTVLVQLHTELRGLQIDADGASIAIGSSTESRLDRSSGCFLVASVARPMAGHRIACDFESLGEGWYHSFASPYATQRRKQKDEI